MTKNWIEMYKEAPRDVQHACRMVMQNRTTIKSETERLGEQNFEYPPVFKDIMWQYKVQGGNFYDLDEDGK